MTRTRWIDKYFHQITINLGFVKLIKGQINMPLILDQGLEHFTREDGGFKITLENRVLKKYIASLQSLYNNS